MDSEPGVTLGTTFYQHQFFPVGDLTADPAEAKWDKCGRYVDSRADRNNDWDVKAWNWDSLLFLAQPSAADKVSASSQFGSHPPPGAAASNGFRFFNEAPAADPKIDSPPSADANKPIVVDDASSLDEDAECLTLKLGGRTYSSTDDSSRNGKRQRSSSPASAPQQPQYPMCQVDDCKADLSNAKDYHRRHKVCEMHSKAAKALVGRLMQRFCQQCSRFHTLQEFDEGKRSCRRRLAGHNRRRRKTQPETAATQAYLLAEEEVAGKNAGLLRLLQALSQLQATNAVEKATERDVALEYLRRAVSVSSALGDCMNTKMEGNAQKAEPKFNSVPAAVDAPLLSALPGMPLLEAFSVLLQNNLRGQGTASQTGQPPVAVPRDQQVSNRAPPPRAVHSVIEVDGPAVRKFPFQSSEAAAVGKESADGNRRSLLTLLGGGRESPPCSVAPSNAQAGQSQQSSESLSGSEQSPESSYADWQERTGRISFKLFDRNPGDFPQLLRTQILEWLSHVPLEMESYIRPGCVVLAIFLSMPRSAWKKLCADLPSNLERLVNSSLTDFWKKGRVLVQVCDRSAYAIDGEVHDVSTKYMDFPQILAVTPLAVVKGEASRFVVQGSNLVGPDTRVFSAYHGKYNLQTWSESEEENEELGDRSLCFTQEPCDSLGRCFIEVERNGVSSFAPVLVAEKSVCAELRSLEDELMAAPLKAEALAETFSFPQDYAEKFIDLAQLAVEQETNNFLHELGWVFQKRHWQSIQEQEDSKLDIPMIKRLLLFTVEREWCAVVRTLLDTLFSFDEGDSEAVRDSLQDINLLHRAVTRNSVALVESLLSYRSSANRETYFFSPDEAGPAGLTPLHIAACMSGAERVIAALTNTTTSQVGLQAWNNARDLKGHTPFDCALAHGNLTYIQLVWSRIAASKGKSAAQVTISIPPKPTSKWTGMEISSSAILPGKARLLLPSSCSSECRRLDQPPNFRQIAGIRGPMYRPFMLSMVAIAAVCVCVCLLLKGPPEVRFVLSPFTWESVQFGPK